ncbi:MAG: AAA family ATPase [Candidatus Accumulibacter sp.]|nr:AAA family ATPase [Accumulibacter sp.]HMX22815.1 AAA family ATPase [Accumulibacter sp.]HMY05996.1 AAA family ATPase [Accumulibacter sp.]
MFQPLSKTVFSPVDQSTWLSPMSSASRTFEPQDFLRFFLGGSALTMLLLIIAQEALGAATTWLVIEIARDITEEHVSADGFIAIVVTQTVSYLAGAISWIYAERAGFMAFARYMVHFSRSNRFQTALLADSGARERVEPFLTSETFDICFDLVYNLQFYLRLFFQLLLNSLVLGIQIDTGLPLSFAAVFVVLMTLQWRLRKPLAAAFLTNQRMTNRMRARTYNAWDNILTGNRYNFVRWYRDFHCRLRDALTAQIRAILAREGWSAVSGVIALVMVLSTTAWVAVQDAGDTALLIALAATLPRQIEMTLDMHQLTSGLTDMIAVWSRIKGVCEHIYPSPDPDFVERIDFGNLYLKDRDQQITCRTLADAMHYVLAQPTGLVALRGGNGSGKSTLLSALKCHLRGRAFYWPTHDRLCFDFNAVSSNTDGASARPVAEDEEEDPLTEAEDATEISAAEESEQKKGYSSGERQIQVLREIVANTDYPLYLLDEWDANLDPANRLIASALVDQLAQRARVLEISHRDRRQTVDGH